MTSVNESTVTCAIRQNRLNELHELFNSGKTSVSQEWILHKAENLGLGPILTAKIARALEKTSDLPDKQIIIEEQKFPESAPVILYDLFEKENLSSQIRHQAIEAAKQRIFIEARLRADSIPLETYRKGTLAEIVTICFEFGDLEAIECALEIAMMRRENRDDYICGFIDECRKLNDKKIAKELSIKAASEIVNPEMKRKHLEKIENFFNK
jgi:hypothetical protein